MQRSSQCGKESLHAGNDQLITAKSSSEEVRIAEFGKKIGSGGDRSYQCLASIVIPKDSIISLATHGSLLYAGAKSGSIRVFEKPTPCSQLVCIGEFGCANTPVKALAIGENRVYSAHQDKKVRIWRPRPDGHPSCPTLKPRSRRHDSPARFELLKTLPTMKECLKKSLRADNYVQVRRHHRGLWVKHVDAVASLSICVEDQLLYSASWDKTVKVWRLSDFKCVESIKAHEDAINAVTSATYGILFTGSADGTVKAWRRIHSKRERQRRGVLQHHEHITTLKSQHKDSPAVNGLALSPDESILYCGTSKGEINYWRMDKASLQVSHKDALCGHERSILCLKTLKKFVCSGSADATIRVWKRSEASTGRISIYHSCLAVLQGHMGPVKCIVASSLTPFSFSSTPSSSSSSSSSSNDLSIGNGLVVYSGSLDGSIKCWWIY